MTADAFIQCRVPAATKAAFSALARHQEMSDSALLKKMIELALQQVTVAAPINSPPPEAPALYMSRLTVRLRPEDQMLLRERAAARGMPPATYVSVYVRSHLRALAPLPEAEQLAVQDSILELGALGRNINKLAQAVNRGESIADETQKHVLYMIQICGTVRDKVKALMLANSRSWGQGHADRQS